MNIKPYNKFLSPLILLVLTSRISYGGLLGPDKYYGVVVFDRWGGCTLYNGIFLMYIAEQVKSQLRPYSNEAIEINATDVFQLDDLDDALIRKFVYLRTAPANPDWLNKPGLRLKTSAAFQNGEKPSVIIEVVNTGQQELEIDSHDLAPTILTQRAGKYATFSASDGPSFALSTGQSFWHNWPKWMWLKGQRIEMPGGGAVWQSNDGENGRPRWSMKKSEALPEHFTLQPQQTRQIKLTFDLSDGEYEFLCGYGGVSHYLTQCIASNLTAFDIKDGRAKTIVIKGR